MINLINDDCISVMKSMPDNSIDLIVTDPPYPVTKKGSGGNMGGMMVTQQTKSGKIFTHNDISVSNYAPEFYRLLRDGSHCYVMTNHINLIEMLNTFTDVGFHFIKSLVWDKQNKISGRFYMSQFEYILFFRKGKGVAINNCGTSDILYVPNIKTKGEDGENIHDTEKPVRLMEILIENSSKTGGTVLDPFMGGGSTGIASVNLNRDFIGIELDKKYFDTAKCRIEQAQEIKGKRLW